MSSACPPMALKSLQRPSRRLLQRCYCTVNSQPMQISLPFKLPCAPSIVPSIPSSTRSFTFAPHLARRSGPYVPLSSGPLKCQYSRSISNSAIRSATPQAGTPQQTQGSSITASYIASAGELELVDVKKVLVIGSGGLSIGQAGEFDYSGVRKSTMLP